MLYKTNKRDLIMSIMRFKEWLGFIEVRDTGTAMQSSHSAARDIGRNANQVIACLMKNIKGWPIKLTAIGGKEDVEDKIDGYFTDGPYSGDSVQIIRRIAERAKDDFAIQIVSKQPSDEEFFDLPLSQLIELYPSKLSAEAQIHLMLNANDDKLFLAKIDDILPFVMVAVKDMKFDQYMLGKFKPNRTFYNAKNGVSIRIAKSREGFSVLAYVPAAKVSNIIIPVSASELETCERPQAPVVTQAITALRPANLQKTDIEIAADAAKETGEGRIEIKSTNPKNIKNKMDVIKKFAAEKKFRMKDNGDGTVSLMPLS